MPEKVLIYSRFPKAQLERFGEQFELLNAAGKPPNEISPPISSPTFARWSAGGTPLRGDAMDLMPKLGAIVCYGTGYDGVDLEAAAKRNIAVGHSPGANAASVADIAVTLMLAATRRLLAADDYVRGGNWAAAKPSPMMRPQAGMLGRKIGVYGMGEIGRKIAARVAAFETEVGYFSRSQHDVPYRYFPTLDALAEWCSVLMIAVRAGDGYQPCRRCRYPEQARQGRLRRQHFARLGHRPAGPGRGADRPDHRRRRPRRVREGAACA